MTKSDKKVSKEKPATTPGDELRPRTSGNVRRVIIRDLTIEATLGVYEHEKFFPQTIVINIAMDVPEDVEPLDDDHRNVVCYASVVNSVKEIVAKGHVHLVETLAERVASACLADTRVATVWVRIEKPDAIEEAAGVGIEIVRTN